MLSRLSTRVWTTVNRRLVSTTVASTGEEPYARSLQYMHWVMAAGIMSCVGLVKSAQWSENKDLKGTLMHYHKSFGLLMLAFIVPRIALRLTTKIPPGPPGPALQRFMGSASHLTFYGLMVALPVSGVVMGYYGGKGLPFFWTTVPGAPEDSTNGPLAKQAFGLHKQMSTVMTYLIPAHIGAVVFHHVAQGHKILRSINPFFKP